MKNTQKSFALLLVMVLMLPSVFQASPAKAAIWQKGISVIPQSTEDFSSSNFQQSMRNFQAAGGTYVNFIIPYYQSNTGSTDIGRGYNTPSDQSLISGINFVHSLGLHAEISIYLETYSGQWRAFIYPGDRDTWYKNYGDVLVHYGQLASQTGAEQFCLGAELIDVASSYVNTDNLPRWSGMIDRVRGVYSGALTYSANRWSSDPWGSEINNILFWDKLDYIGLSAYYELYGDGSVASLESNWQSLQGSYIDPIENRWHKPIIFTEIGYRSVDNAHSRPWDSTMGGNYNPQEQVNDYTALFDYWNKVGYMQGVFLWWWSPDANYGGNGNTDYTPQNKPAMQTLAQFWGTNTPPPPPPPSGGGGTAIAPTATANGSANPASATVGTPVTLNSTIQIAGGPLQNGVVDLEVYDQSSNKVFQQFFDNQNINAGSSQSYSATWTPTSNGTYRMTAGVFSSGWSQNYTWNNDAADITIGSQMPPPPPPSQNPPPTNTSYNTDIWWPSDGSHVSGLQPFKAMVQGIDVSQYSMFWQVDNGNLVPMDTNMTDYPHKEALVDLSGWNWSNNGQYTITFVSKNTSGTTISSKNALINIP